MFELLRPKFGDFINLKNTLSSFLDAYYRLRQESGIRDESWQKFTALSNTLDQTPLERSKDLIQLYTEDAPRSHSTFKSGNMVAFEYTRKRDGKKQSYFVMVVGTKLGNGMHYNVNTKNNLLSGFLIDSGTNLNILARVAEVIQEKNTSPSERKYQSLEDDRLNRSVRKDAGVSKDGLARLFPTTKFRTFIINTNMENVYRLNLDG